jgi:hypothetical protein
MMSKLGPFKDWGVVNFLQERLGKAGGDIAKNIGDVVLKGESPAKAVMDVIRGSESNFSAKDVMDAQDLLERDLALYEKEIRLEELENEDRERASNQFLEMQKSDSWLTRNYVMLLATIVIIFGFSMVGTLIFKEIPEGNKTLFTAAFGYVLGAVSTVVIFFFGDNDKNRNS